MSASLKVILTAVKLVRNVLISAVICLFYIFVFKLLICVAASYLHLHLSSFQRKEKSFVYRPLPARTDG